MSFGINARDLDNYITGNYGEDQFKDEQFEEDGDDAEYERAVEEEALALDLENREEAGEGLRLDDEQTGE